MSDTNLSFILCDLNTNHSYVIFNAFNIHLSGSKNIFLNVGLFIKYTELIITIDELDTSDITILTCLFILLAKTLHISLKRDNNHIQFLDFISILINKLLFLLFFQIIFVKLCLCLISFMNFKLKHVIIVLDSLIFLCTFIFQNFLLILKNFDTFF